VGRIAAFLAVDDGTPAADLETMQRAFPFVRFVAPEGRRRGHAASMNVLLDATHDLDLLFHTEDDRELRRPFALADAIALIQAGLAQQVMLQRHPSCAARAESWQGIPYWVHEHDDEDARLPWFFREWLTARPGGSPPSAAGQGCWWPSFSLGPSVWDLRAFRRLGERFDEDLDPTYFEYEISLRLAAAGWRVAMLDGDIEHLPAVTAYVLNDQARLFDGVGCGPHREIGGLEGCPACAEQRARHGNS